MPENLTEKQKAVFDYLEDYIARNGFSPTIKEIAGYMHIYPAAVSQHLRLIERKGYIKRVGKRAIRILK